MPPSPTADEARRILGICNACRYCEGLCAVFPALERRRALGDGDLTYLANLCHNCRGCYHACQYAPPHEFSVNVPRTLERLRRETYGAGAWPRALGRAFRRNGRVVAAVTVASVGAALLLALAFGGPSVLWGVRPGEGAFYRVVPYGLMVAAAGALSAYALVALAMTGAGFWRTAGPEAGIAAGPRELARAAVDALRLTYLGGGYGCDYPGERSSSTRRWLHHLVFYGFLLDLASTSVAAWYHHVFRLEAPYPVLSVPVVLGTAGGVALLVGTAGLLWIKWRRDPGPTDAGSRGMDVAFLALLHLTSLTGLALLAFRGTAAMGVLLVVHLGVVAAFFVTAPYGKLVHAVLRYGALVRYAAERSREEA